MSVDKFGRQSSGQSSTMAPGTSVRYVNNNCIRRDGSNGIEGELSMNNHKLVNLSEPTEAQDAATRGFTRNNFLKIDGTNNMEGDLNADNHKIINLSYIFNKSLSEGDYPLRWKQANIIPLHKSGDKSSPCNYRPIALLPSVSKILEKIACKQFSNFLKSKNILSKRQSGFREKHSTVTALARVSDDWLCATDNGQYTGAVLIDMKKSVRYS